MPPQPVTVPSPEGRNYHHEAEPCQSSWQALPKRLVPWANFPSLQKSIWKKLDTTDFLCPLYGKDHGCLEES